MTLQDYTTEELRAELKRRAKESRRKAAEERMKQGLYAYARAIITHVQGSTFRERWYAARMVEEDLAKIPTNHRYRYERARGYDLLKSQFTKDTEPRVGDVVTLRFRKTKNNPDGFGTLCAPYITEVIERKGE